MMCLERRRTLAVPLGEAGEWWPVFSTVRTPDAVVVTGILRDLDPASLDLSIEPERLTVRGRRRAGAGEPAETYAVTILLPAFVEADRSVGAVQDGVLMVMLPTLLGGRRDLLPALGREFAARVA